jgi:hypothetical protein
MFTDLFDDKPTDEIEIPVNGISLDLLQAVYRSNAQPLAVRLRAAIAALPHEVPKLIATAQVNEGSFAELLEQRLKRVAEAKLIEHQRPAIESKTEVKPALAHTPDKRFRRL